MNGGLITRYADNKKDPEWVFFDCDVGVVLVPSTSFRALRSLCELVALRATSRAAYFISTHNECPLVAGAGFEPATSRL